MRQDRNDQEQNTRVIGNSGKGELSVGGGGVGITGDTGPQGQYQIKRYDEWVGECLSYAKRRPR